jgi:hypothetical protein
MKLVMLHPIKINVRLYPFWERFRVAFECLIFGEASFQGQITNVKSEQPKDTLPPIDPAAAPSTPPKATPRLNATPGPTVTPPIVTCRAQELDPTFYAAI